LLGCRPCLERAAGQLVSRVQPVAGVRTRCSLAWRARAPGMAPAACLPALAWPLAGGWRPARVRLARARLSRPRQPEHARVAVARIFRADARRHGTVRR